MKNYLFIIAVTFIAMYLVISFSVLSLDPKVWGYQNRNLFVILSPILSFLFCAIYEELFSNSKSN